MLRRITVSIFCLLVSLIMIPISQAQTSKLSPEGIARKAAHEFLFGDYAKGKALDFSGQGPYRILKEIVISTERREFSGDQNEGEVAIPLPPGSARVAGKFRYLVLKGEGLDHLGGLQLTPYVPDADMPVSNKTSEIYRVKVVGMPIPTEGMEDIVLRAKCEPGKSVIVTEIALNSQNKLAEAFDDIPFRNLGEEFPRLPVDLKIDLTKELSIGGFADLERDRFCRYYAAPGTLGSDFEHWANRHHFKPGRQMIKFQPALVRGYSKNQPTLTESETRPGAADLSFFDRYRSATPKTIDAFEEAKYAMCINDYPEFMSVKKVGRGTPLVEHFGDAAELAAAYIEDQQKDGGRTAAYWEVKNEATIKSEWDYHFRQDCDSWKLMADFHNEVATAVHQRTPEVKVGGPSSAWMQIQVNDFGLYQNQLRFMDLTKGKLDFYSHHFYETSDRLGRGNVVAKGNSNYLLGRSEAILDMFAAHMHQTDNVRPILITECGSLQPGRGPSDYWLRIRSFSAYMHKFMQRPDQIELAVPFVFLSIPWNPKSGNAVFIPKPGQRNNAPLDQCETTPVEHFFELWSDFDGRRLPVSWDRDFLDVTAVHRGNRIQLAVTNMGGRQLSLNVKSVVGDLPVDKVSQNASIIETARLCTSPKSPAQSSMDCKLMSEKPRS